MTLRLFMLWCFQWSIAISFHADEELMVVDGTMTLLRMIAPRTVWCTRRRYRFDSHYRLSSCIEHIEQTNHPVFHTSKRPMHCHADQYNVYPLQCKIKMYMPKLCRVRNFSSLRKPLLFTDDALQRYIKQIVGEWSQIQKQWTVDQCDDGGGLTAAKHSSERLSFLEQVVSKVMQHQQYSANITELQDIISGMCSFYSSKLLVNFFVIGSSMLCSSLLCICYSDTD